MRLIVGCENSQRVAAAFRRRGHDAWSCDLLPTSGDPRYHIQGDVLDHLDDGWDAGIFHPTCTYLTGAAEWAYVDVPMVNGKPKKLKPGTLVGAERRAARQEAADFVERLWNADIEKLCIENPVGVINKLLPFMPKPQYVQQYWFGEDASKKTGLWLRNLPPLVPTNIIEPRWGNQTNSGQNKLPPSADRWKIRSDTPLGLADAMAEQWGSETPCAKSQTEQLCLTIR